MTDEVMLRMDNFNDCILGVCERFGQRPFIVYDRDQVIEKLVTEEDMSTDDAWDWYFFNMLGSGLDGAPGFVDTNWDESEYE